MKERITRSYQATQAPDGQWTVYRITEARSGPWYRRQTSINRIRLGSAIDEKGIQGLINRDIIKLEPERAMKTSNYDSAGRSTDYHGW